MQILKKTAAILLCAGCVAFTAPETAAASQPTLEELQAQIVALQKQIAQLLETFKNRSNVNNGNAYGLYKDERAGLQGIYGTVDEVNADGDTITVTTTIGDKSYTVNIGENTNIIEVTENDGKIERDEIDLADINENDKVWVRGDVDDNEKTVNADTVRVGDLGWANLDWDKNLTVRGTVTEAGSDEIEISVKKPGSGKETAYQVIAGENLEIIEVSVEDGKVIRNADKDLADIEKGDVVSVRGTIDEDDNDIIVATEIKFGDINGYNNGWDRNISGKVTDADDDEITVRASGVEYTVTENDDGATIIKIAKGSDNKFEEKEMEFKDIAVDDTVWIKGTVDDQEKTVEATEIRVGVMGWIRSDGPGNGAGKGQGNAWGFQGNNKQP